MSNMSYCRFRNTVQDLRDCQEHLDEDLDREEKVARDRLLKICKNIALDYCDCVEEKPQPCGACGVIANGESEAMLK